MLPNMSRAEKSLQNKERRWSDFWVNIQFFLAVVSTGTFLILSIILGIIWFRSAGAPGEKSALKAEAKPAPVVAAPAASSAGPVIIKLKTNAMFGDNKLLQPDSGKQALLHTQEALRGVSVVVNVPSKTLGIYSGNNLIKEYPVAVGKPATPTPLGTYQVGQKEMNPTWYPPRRNLAVPSGPQNPLGYRWIGFAPLYGIHGTNAPSFIGYAVSNGCVRMREQDVEEVYEMVGYGASVKITYELVKVSVDNQGKASIGVYPDVYGYKNQRSMLAEAKEKLAALGLDGLVADGALQKIVGEQAGEQIEIARLSKVKVNDTLLGQWAISTPEALYIPVWAVAGRLQQDIVWDSQNNAVKYRGRNVPAVRKGDMVFVAADGILTLFGGMKLWRQQENCVEFAIPSLAKRQEMPTI